MPRKKPFAMYSVFIEYTDNRSSMPFQDSSERKAAWAFYQAVKSAYLDPLAYKVKVVRRDGEQTVLLQVQILR